MCGVAGWAWKNPPSRVARKALAIALGVYNDERGGRGFGFLDVDKQKIYKDTETFTRFIANQGTDWALSRQGFLHTRMPSHGAVIQKNCHPFVFKNIIGAHNGVIRNHAELNRKYSRSFDVDSEHIFCHLSEGRSLQDIEGYGTIEWYNRADKMIRLLSFNSGMLDIVHIKNVGIIWSSERRHLEKALEAAGLDDKVRYYSIDQRMIYVVQNGELTNKKKLTSADTVIPVLPGRVTGLPNPATPGHTISKTANSIPSSRTFEEARGLLGGVQKRHRHKPLCPETLLPPPNSKKPPTEPLYQRLSEIVYQSKLAEILPSKKESGVEVTSATMDNPGGLLPKDLQPQTETTHEAMPLHVATSLKKVEANITYFPSHSKKRKSEKPPEDKGTTSTPTNPPTQPPMDSPCPVKDRTDTPSDPDEESLEEVDMIPILHVVIGTMKAAMCFGKMSPDTSISGIATANQFPPNVSSPSGNISLPVKNSKSIRIPENSRS